MSPILYNNSCRGEEEEEEGWILLAMNHKRSSICIKQASPIYQVLFKAYHKILLCYYIGVFIILGVADFPKQLILTSPEAIMHFILIHFPCIKFYSCFADNAAPVNN